MPPDIIRHVELHINSLLLQTISLTHLTDMFGIFSIFRFSPSVTVLTMVGAAALTGCQCFSPKPAVTPPLSPVQPVIRPSYPVEPDRYSVFRPVMPEETLPPQAMTAPILQPQPDAAALARIDELNRRITELETQLADAVKLPPSPPVEKNMPSVFLPPPLKNLPLVNKQGVDIYRVESRSVHFVVMDNVLFLPNVWQLSADGEETLRAIAAEISAFDPEATLDIEGHTDSLMNDPNNPAQKHEIASAKAKAVMDFFVDALCWETDRLKTSSFGRNQPIAENGTPEGREKNNRIEIIMRSQNEQTEPQS